MSALLLFRCVLAVLTTASLTNTVTTGSICAPLRRWCARRRELTSWRIVRTACFLPLCPYCLSHWIAGAVTLSYGVSWMAILPVAWLAQQALLWSLMQTTTSRLQEAALQQAQRRPQMPVAEGRS